MLWRGIVFIMYKNPILSFSYWLALIFSLLNTCVIYFPRCLIFPVLFKGSLWTSYTLILCTQWVNELKMLVSKGIKVLLGNQVRDLWDSSYHQISYLYVKQNLISPFTWPSRNIHSPQTYPQTEKQFISVTSRIFTKHITESKHGFFWTQKWRHKGPL